MAFWTQKDGVLTHNGKDIKFGDKIPSDIDKSTLDRLIKSGKAANALPQHAAAVVGDEAARLSAELTTRLGEITKLKKEITTTDQTIAGLKDEIAKLTDELATSNETIIALTNQLTAPAPAEAPVPDAAGPTGAKK